MSVAQQCTLALALVLFCGQASGEDIITVPLTKRADPLFINDKLVIFHELFDETDPRQVIHTLAALPGAPLARSDEIAFTDKTVWLKMTLANPSANEQRLSLYSGFPIARIVLITASGPEKGSMLVSGTRATDKAYPDAILPSFPIHLRPGITTFYLGISAFSRPFNLSFALWDEASFLAHDALRTNFLLAFIAGCIGVILIHLMYGFVMRNPMYFWYASCGAGFLALTMSASGMATILPIPLALPVARSWLLWCAIIFGSLTVIINKVFDVSRERFPFTHYLSRIFLVFTALAPGLGVLWARPVALSYIICGVLVYLNSFLLAVLSLKIRTKAAVLYLLSFTPVLVTAIPFILSGLNIIEGAPLFAMLLLGGFFMTMYLLSFTFGVSIGDIERSYANLRHSLQGVIAPQQIDNMVRIGINLLRKPTQQNVTIMFVDIVGYTRTLRRMEARQAFFELKRILTDLHVIVHRHGGVTDKTLGDGILCFFGYELTGKIKEGHENSALQCAIDIHQHVIARILAWGGHAGEPMFPIRIGINTADVIIGNMGTQGRFDVTLAGNGVILANRFEMACEPFKVILGRDTFTRLGDQYTASRGFNRIMVPIKHQAELVEAYEYNPFHDALDNLYKAHAVIWATNKAKQLHPRYHPLAPVTFTSTFGSMGLINFSLGGLCLTSPILLSKGVPLQLSYEGGNSDEYSYLLNPLVVEVMWSTVSEQGSYQLGLLFLGLNQKERELIFSIMRRNLVTAMHAKAV